MPFTNANFESACDFHAHILWVMIVAIATTKVTTRMGLSPQDKGYLCL